LHTSNHNTKITRGVNLVSWDSKLSTLLLQIIGEGVIDGEDLTLGVTFGLNWQFNQIFIGGDACSSREAWGHSSIETSASYPRGICTGHLSFHAANLVEAVERDEWDELWLVLKDYVRVGRGGEILSHVGEYITSSPYSL